MPPEGKLEASGSPWISALPENSATAPPSPSGARKLSCFSAVRPVKRIEDVGVVSRALLDGPGLDGRSHGVGDRAIELLAFFDRPLERLEDLLRQPLLHLGQAKHVGTIEFAGRRFGEVQRGRNGFVIRNCCDRLQTRRAATHVLIPPYGCIRKRKNEPSDPKLYTMPTESRRAPGRPEGFSFGRCCNFSVMQLPIS